MSREGKFLVYCLEIYRAAKNLTGGQAIALFKRYGVSGYVITCYEALHTTGANYIVEDIDLFVKEPASPLHEKPGQIAAARCLLAQRESGGGRGTSARENILKLSAKPYCWLDCLLLSSPKSLSCISCIPNLFPLFYV